MFGKVVAVITVLTAVAGGAFDVLMYISSKNSPVYNDIMSLMPVIPWPMVFRLPMLVLPVMLAQSRNRLAPMWGCLGIAEPMLGLIGVALWFALPAKKRVDEPLGVQHTGPPKQKAPERAMRSTNPQTCAHCGHEETHVAYLPSPMCRSKMPETYRPDVHGDVIGNETIGVSKGGQISYRETKTAEGYTRIHASGGNRYKIYQELIPKHHVALCRPCVTRLNLELLGLRCLISAGMVGYGFVLYSLSAYSSGKGSVPCVFWFMAIVAMYSCIVALGIPVAAILHCGALLIGSQKLLGQIAASVQHWGLRPYTFHHIYRA